MQTNNVKAKYRSKLELYMSILDNCQDALIHSSISRKCNVSHYDTAKHLEFLVSLNMLDKMEIDKSNHWKLTPYGLETLKKLKEVHDLFTESDL